MFDVTDFKTKEIWDTFLCGIVKHIVLSPLFLLYFIVNATRDVLIIYLDCFLKS